MPAVPIPTAAELGQALAQADPALAADATANLAELRALAPRVVEALRRAHDHSARLDQALAAAGMLDAGGDPSFAELAVTRAVDAAWSLADTLALAHPDRWWGPGR